MPFRRLAGVGFLVDRHKAHQPHEPTDALLVHYMAIVAQVPRLLSNAEERRVEELHIDQPHQRKVLLGLSLRRIVERRPRDRQQRALSAHGKVRMVAFDHTAPQFPPQGSSSLSKKELATAGSPILACRSLT